MKNQNRDCRKRINKSTSATVIMCGLLVIMLVGEFGVALASTSFYRADAQTKAVRITVARTVQPVLMDSGEARIWLASDAPPAPPPPPKPPKKKKENKWKKRLKKLKKIIDKIDKIVDVLDPPKK